MTKPVFEPLEQRRHLDGTPDPSYGSAGVVLTSFRNTNDAVSMAFLADGSQVVVGTTQAAGKTKDIFVAKYTPAGALDPAFGVGGVTFLDLGFEDIATTVKVQSDGKVIAAGTTGDIIGLTGDAWVGRWTATGQLDKTFNKTGYRVIDFGGADAVSDMLLERAESSDSASPALTSDEAGDGVIVLSGVSASLTAATSGIVIAKVLDTGILDTGYGPSGTGIFRTTPGPGFFDGATSISRFGSRYLVSGFQFQALAQRLLFMVAAFDSDCGAFDPNFGNNGRRFVNFGNDIEMAMDARYDRHTNSIYAVGVTGNGLTELAPGIPRPSLTGVATDARFAVARLTTLGDLDTTFNGTGMNTLDFPGYSAGASGLVIQGGGKLIAGGGGQNLSTGSSDFTLGRFNWDGSLDSTFGDNGRIVADLGASDGAFRLFQPRGVDDSFYAIGHSKFDSTFGQLAMVRYLLSSPPPATKPPAFSVANIRRIVAPTSGALEYKVHLSHAPTTPVTVNYATRDGLSLAGIDYDATAGELTFNPGEMTKSIFVNYHDSHNGALPGSIHLDLSAPTGGAFLTNPTGTASLEFLAPNLNQVRVTKVAPQKFPNQIVPGTGFATLFSKVTVRNFGTTAIKGNQTLSVYASTDRRLELGRDPILGKLKVALNLAPGKSQSFDVPLTFPTGRLDTSYFMIGSASGKGVSQTATNVARATNRFLVAAPIVTLVSSEKAQKGVKVAYGKTVPISFPLTNSGTAAAVGKANFLLNLTTDGTLDTLRLFYPIKKFPINIEAGKSSTLTMNLIAPPASSGIPKGKYIMLVQLVTTKIPNKNTTDGTIVARIPFRIV